MNKIGKRSLCKKVNEERNVSMNLWQIFFIAIGVLLVLLSIFALIRGKIPKTAMLSIILGIAYIAYGIFFNSISVWIFLGFNILFGAVMSRVSNNRTQ